MRASRGQNPNSSCGTEQRAPAWLRRCTVCGSTDLAAMGLGKGSVVWECVPARFERHEAGGPPLSLRRLHRHGARGAEGRLEGTVWRELPRCTSPSPSAEHLPIYRPEKEFARKGIPVARSRMNERLHRASALLAPAWSVVST